MRKAIFFLLPVLLCCGLHAGTARVKVDFDGRSQQIGFRDFKATNGLRSLLAPWNKKDGKQQNNYLINEPIEIRLFCENGKVTFTYDDAYIDYNDGTHEEAHKDEKPQVYGGGKDYWGSTHIKQIQQFYRSCLGLEELEISGEHALKTHKLICDIYDAGGMRK